MFDLNAIVNAALQQAVAEAIKPLVERIEKLENNPAQGVDAEMDLRVGVLSQRVTALESDLNEASLGLLAANNVTPAQIVDAMNSAEWLWEKVSAYIETGIEAGIERAMDDHTSNYDHDSYDSLYQDWSDYDPASFVSEDTIEEKVNDTLRNASFEIRVL
jgi:hypothetical protein